MKQLVDELYPDPKVIRVVLDNLNTPTKASLYATFDPKTASRLSKKLESIYTPKHGTGLNAIKIEFSVLERQCLDRRIGSLEMLRKGMLAGERNRNQRGVTSIGD